jgi:hypothetical protein
MKVTPQPIAPKPKKQPSSKKPKSPGAEKPYEMPKILPGPITGNPGVSYSKVNSSKFVDRVYKTY